MLDSSLSHVIEMPSLLLNVFTDAFHDNVGPGEAWQEAWLDFQFGLLHMLGAMLSSSNVCHNDSVCELCFTTYEKLVVVPSHSSPPHTPHTPSHPHTL